MTLRLTPRLGGAPGAWIGERVRAAVARICDAELAALAGERFVGHLACDDLDTITGLAWPIGLRRRTVRVEGANALPPPGRALFVSFHLSGGFRIFDVLSGLGYRPGLIAAWPVPQEGRYSRALAAARRAYWRRSLPSSVYFVGRDVPRHEARTPALHLRDGGSLVALLDVPVGRLWGRDKVQVPLFGTTMELPLGIVRLATRARIPIVVFDSRLEDGVRALRFHQPIVTTDPEDAMRQAVACLERVILERPWEWHGWLDA